MFDLNMTRLLKSTYQRVSLVWYFNRYLIKKLSDVSKFYKRTKLKYSFAYFFIIILLRFSNNITNTLKILKI